MTKKFGKCYRNIPVRICRYKVLGNKKEREEKNAKDKRHLDVRKMKGKKELKGIKGEVKEDVEGKGLSSTCDVLSEKMKRREKRNIFPENKYSEKDVGINRFIDIEKDVTKREDRERE